MITKIISDHYSVDKQVSWLKCRTDRNTFVYFWGELGKPNRNLVSISSQVLPLCIEIILDPECCEPTQYEKSKYGIALGIPLDVYMQINPEQ